MHVRFQPKAWFDDDLCAKYAAKEAAEICEEARSKRQQTLFIVDNLSGHTTAEFLHELKKHMARRHLLPTGVTDELQLIDDGVGIAVKREMGDAFDRWAADTGNLERWTAEKKDDSLNVNPMQAWEKRALITHLAAEAWEKVCRTFDFEKSSTRLGMRMTADGTNDEIIKIQGMPEYSFNDADGGDPGEESGDDPVDAAEMDEDVEDVEDDGGEVGEEESEEDEFVGGSDESDGDESEDDDTVPPGDVRTTVGSAVAPSGYRIVEGCPPLETLPDRQKLIGKLVYVGWDSNGVYGWFMGTIHSTTISPRDRQKTPTANFVIKYTKQRTRDQLNGLVACELSARIHGPNKWWVLLEKQH